MLEAACGLAGRRGILVKDDDADVIQDHRELQPGDIPAVECPEPETDGEETLPVIAVPEHSHPGESKSNGLSERAVQALEDHVRTLKVSLESRLGVTVPVHHPVFAWLIEHAAYLLNTYSITSGSDTAWGRLHGHQGHERICEFGERYFGMSLSRSAIKWMSAGDMVFSSDAASARTRTSSGFTTAPSPMPKQLSVWSKTYGGPLNG